jgi:hypothetical protein
MVRAVRRYTATSKARSGKGQCPRPSGSAVGDGVTAVFGDQTHEAVQLHPA